MELRPSERKRAKIKLGLQGPIGSGKTYSSLLLAGGLTNDLKKVVIIDTENGSADLYAHLGEYKVLRLTKPFTPERYIEALETFEKGYKVLFVTVPQLITQIRESRSERRLRTLENRFEKYDLVICDEFGYISFDKEGAELLFTHLSLRTGKKATIITTNLSFDRWSEIFGDPVLTAAMVDRITHRAHIINMNGKSYRAKETKEWNQK